MGQLYRRHHLGDRMRCPWHTTELVPKKCHQLSALADESSLLGSVCGARRILCL